MSACKAIEEISEDYLDALFVQSELKRCLTWIPGYQQQQLSTAASCRSRLKLLAIVKCIKSSSCHPLDAFPTCALRLSYLENHRTAPAAATVVGGRSGLQLSCSSLRSCVPSSYPLLLPSSAHAECLQVICSHCSRSCSILRCERPHLRPSRGPSPPQYTVVPTVHGHLWSSRHRPA